MLAIITIIIIISSSVPGSVLSTRDRKMKKFFFALMLSKVVEINVIALEGSRLTNIFLKCFLEPITVILSTWAREFTKA